MKSANKKITLALAAALFVLPAFSAAAEPLRRATIENLQKQVRHELVMLPWFSVFDNMAFQVSPEGVVTLYGQVIRPTLKSSAENVVRQVEGVTSVVNKIEVLPLSNFDDNIRLAVARSIYGYPALSRYAWGANPPIRIIVKNGNVTLEGVVANKTDSNIAFIRANSVSGVFNVTNNLRVEQS